jgi:hypothetical protein
MRRFVEGADRGQWTLLPECLDDFIEESNPVLRGLRYSLALRFDKALREAPQETNRPARHRRGAGPKPRGLSNRSGPSAGGLAGAAIDVCRQGGLTARPYNVADAVLFLSERDRLSPRPAVGCYFGRSFFHHSKSTGLPKARAGISQAG